MRKPYLINLLLEDQEVNQGRVIEKYGLDKGLPKIDLTSLTSKTEFTVDPYTFLGGGSLPTDYMLLKILTEKFGSCTYFEIGTWRGESASNVAGIAEKVFTLNLSEKQMKEKGWEEQYIRLHGFFSKGKKNIEHLEGDSLEFDFSPYHNKCDVIFIDGDHRYDAVKKDTESCFKLRRDEKSIVVWHDYGESTETTRWEVLLGILDGLPPEEHRHLYSVNNTLCAIYYPYPVKSFYPDFPQSPKTNFSLNIKINNVQ